MKWFRRKKNIKKRDEKGTYLRLENGRVVPVTGDEKNPKPDESRPEYKENPDTPETNNPKWLKWIWLIVILGLGYGTIQLMGGLATENKENFKLQEIQRNTLQALEEPGVKTTEKKPSEKESDSNPDTSTSIEEKATQWKEEIKNGFTHSGDKKESEVNVVETNDRTLLFDIRSLDEEGTQFLEQIRDASVSYISGDISRGQYLLRLQAIDLKVKRYNQEISVITEQAKEKPSYDTLIEYIVIKKESLKSLTLELRVSSSDNVARIFNGYVDTHNDLSKESDKEFVTQLNELGYEAKIKNGVIQYQNQ